MATTYTMKLDGVQVKWSEEQFSDVVTAITYVITGISDDGIRKDWRKQIPLPLPSSPDFIPIQDITEEIMTSWVLNSPDYLTETDIRIFNCIYRCVIYIYYRNAYISIKIRRTIYK
jgi:hypothetical protein